MPRTEQQHFTTDLLEILSPEGQVDSTLLPHLSDHQLLRLYELLSHTRLADQRALDLQREGRLGTYPSSLGQEAAQVGSAYALRPQDWVFPAFRELGMFLCRDFPLERIYQFWNGDERGLMAPEGINIFPMCIAVGTHILHAAGAALAAQYRNEDAVMVAYVGDGGTSKGDFHEALNMAGVYALPLVVICQNNQWAISVSRKAQTAAATLAQKAIAYGVHGLQVDGNDVLAVYQATCEARERALSGGGPSLIEALTYRMSDHTTADDARRYRDPAELEHWQHRDPLKRMRIFLEGRGLWDAHQQSQLERTLKLSVDEAVRTAEAVPPPDPDDIFTYSCHSLSSRQQQQRQECLNERN